MVVVVLVLLLAWARLVLGPRGALTLRRPRWLEVVTPRQQGGARQKVAARRPGGSARKGSRMLLLTLEGWSASLLTMETPPTLHRHWRASR